HLTPPSPPYLYTLSLHDALPISLVLSAAINSPKVSSSRWTAEKYCAISRRTAGRSSRNDGRAISDSVNNFNGAATGPLAAGGSLDRKSTRLNSSHVSISYAVFCL